MLTGGWPCPSGHEEYALRFDEGRLRRILVVPALFDEGNKLRSFTVDVMRQLDALGIDSVLPDLPGCNESLSPLSDQTLAGWRAAVEAAAEHFDVGHVLAIRSGALCLPDTQPVILYAPQTGEKLLRQMLRARVVADREVSIASDSAGLLERGWRDGLTLGGYRIGAQLIRDLAIATDIPAGPVIAQTDIGGPGLWLRAEAASDAGQARAMAERIGALDR